MKLAGILALLWLTACSDGGPAAPAAQPAGDSLALVPDAATPAACPAEGRLSLRFYGALEGEVEWAGPEFSCAGMPRPEGQGARLRFAGNAGESGQALAVIIALPSLRQGETGNELPSNVTVIEEGKARFFSTPDLEHCWTDISRQAPRAGQQQIVEGRLYCIAPLGEVNGESSLSIEALAFTGFIDWDAS